MTPLESSIEPPGRLPFSSTTGASPSSLARAAATSPAMPAPAISTLRERKLWLVLDVFELDPLWAPDEDGKGIRGIDDGGDVITRVLCLGSRVDEAGEVVEGRPVLPCARPVGVQLQVGRVDRRPRCAVGARLGGTQPQVGP